MATTEAMGLSSGGTDKTVSKRRAVTTRSRSCFASTRGGLRIAILGGRQTAKSIWCEGLQRISARSIEVLSNREGVQTDQGMIEADQIVVAAGTATEGIAASLT